MAELFALGTVSGRPGLYLARRVDVAQAPVGVIVVKVEFDQIEASWSRSPGATVVTDRNGVILITSVPSWRFRPTRRLDPAMINDARQSLQFGVNPMRPPPFQLTGRDARTRKERFRVARLDVPLFGSQLLHLSALAAPEAAARSQAFLWLLGMMLLIGFAGATSIRAAERRTMQRRARVALEEEVGRRTAELRESNTRLAAESVERLEAERQFRAAREALAQANRLGSLGQITAGVAHEINQPLAAIRAFAENGTAYLARGATEKANDNLIQIVALTDRVGTITAELRAFSRRKSPSRGSATIGSILDGLMLLLGEQARAVVQIEVAQAERTIIVVGDRIRLEQILVNLVQNALDAVHGRPRPRITIRLDHGADESVELRILDNGTGVEASIRDSLFTPFASTKEEGLGLGLAIARDLAREFGGELDHSGSKNGAEFILKLRQA